MNRMIKWYLEIRREIFSLGSDAQFNWLIMGYSIFERSELLLLERAKGFSSVTILTKSKQPTQLPFEYIFKQ